MAHNRSIGEMRMDSAEMQRDMKREGASCAKGLCTAPASRDGPKGYVGDYGGSRLCDSCYEEVVDYLGKHGHLPNEEHAEGWCDE
jgi:hypothetical protein